MNKDILECERYEMTVAVRGRRRKLRGDDLVMDLERLARVFEGFVAEQVDVSAGDRRSEGGHI